MDGSEIDRLIKGGQRLNYVAARPNFFLEEFVNSYKLPSNSAKSSINKLAMI